jgi:hypothetical protein
MASWNIGFILTLRPVYLKNPVQILRMVCIRKIWTGLARAARRGLLAPHAIDDHYETRSKESVFVILK